MFKLQYPYTATSEASAILRNQLPEVCGLFTQVEALVQLFMVVPEVSAEAEKSFSAPRRLKTWLRITMVQIHLNSVAVCHIHKEILDEVSKGKFARTLSLRMSTVGMCLVSIEGWTKGVWINRWG